MNIYSFIALLVVVASLSYLYFTSKKKEKVLEIDDLDSTEADIVSAQEAQNFWDSLNRDTETTEEEVEETEEVAQKPVAPPFNRKLTDDQVREIRSYDVPDIPALAAKHKVSTTTIRNVVTYTSYLDVE